MKFEAYGIMSVLGVPESELIKVAAYGIRTS
jgi:hypothetical protein